ASVLDAKRLIFYAGTAPGSGKDEEAGLFLAYDVKNHKALCVAADGPKRALLLARSTGKVYFARSSDGALMRYDPDKGGDPVKIDGDIGARAVTQETPQGIVYTVSQGQKGSESTLYAFETKTEKVSKLGPIAVGGQQYVASLAADPSGRYLYYIPGAHGGSDADASPLRQHETQTNAKKVSAVPHTFCQQSKDRIP